jgi:MoaA/NifB/PqqE/SkfB family radical SAM enzyme
MSYEMFEDICNWGKTDKHINILGGEPTLHPDFIRMLRLASNVSHACVLTNLLCKQELLEEFIKIPNVDYLFNTTTRDDLKSLFYSNLEYIYKNLDFILSNNVDLAFGLTLVNNEEIDNKYIDNMCNIMNKFPGLVKIIRMGLANPVAGEKYKLQSFNNAVNNMINRILPNYNDVKLMFDCPPNNCQISPRLMGECMENPRIFNFYLKCSPTLEILSDGSILLCYSCPKFLRIDSYKKFKNSFEAHRWYDKKINEYYNRAIANCNRSRDLCDNPICCGPCPAMNESLKNSF